MSTLRVTYRRSAIGHARDQKATIAALGLRRLQQTVEHRDTPTLRGMVHKVRHLVSVDGVAADSAAGLALLASRTPEAGAAAVTPPEQRMTLPPVAVTAAETPEQTPPTEAQPAPRAPRRRARTADTDGESGAGKESP